MKTLKTSLAALALLAAAAGGAQAAEDTATFQVRIVITESCTISTTAPTDVDFLTRVRATAAPVDAQGTLTVNCSQGTPYQIGLSGGTNSTGTAATPAAGERRMINATGAYVPYDLFSNAARSQFWGNTLGSNTVSATGTAANVAHAVYGRVPSTNFPAGTYTDTVTARVVY